MLDIKNDFQSIIDKMPNAFAYCQLTEADNQEELELIILAANRKFEEITALKNEKIIGKRLSEIINKIKDCSFNLQEFQQKLNQKDGEVIFEQYFSSSDKWYQITISSQEQNFFTATFYDITASKEKEVRLKKEKDHLHNMFDNLNDIIWSISWPDLEVEFVSRAVEDIIGYSAADFKADPELFQKITHPEDKKINDQILKKIEKEGYAEREIRVIARDGSVKWVHDKAKMFYDQNNHPVRLEGVMRDITASRQTEEKLKYNRERYRTIFKSAPIGILIEDENGKISEVNENLCEMSGYSKEELEGSNVLDKFVLPEYQDQAKENIKKIIKGQDLEFDVITAKKDGEYIYKFLKETNIVLPDGKKGIISMHIDITERKEMEKELTEKNILLNSILESIQDGISVLNPDLSIRYANSKMKEWYNNGLPLKGEKCFEVYYNQDEPCEICPVKKSLKSSKIEHIEKKLPEGFGVSHVEIFSYPIYNEEENEITGVVEFVRDISERKEREREIKHLLYRDSLTDLYNRRFFEEELHRLDTSKQLPISIIMGDLNGLKLINDTYGHKKGDEMLVRTAEILKSVLRSEDILARHGGDEFTILLPQTTNKQAEKIVDRIKNESEKITEPKIPISIGMGVATKTKVGEDIDNILQQADNEMYKIKLSESRSTKNRVLQNLINTLGAKSSETKEHAVRMSKLAVKLGKNIGLSNSELNRLSLLATLHDIGKTTISEEILTKEDKLTKKEWEIIKEHPERGYKIASASEEFSLVAEEILCHHERWDGNGYPEGLKAEKVPFLARIISIIDAYDVMTNDRPYSKAIPVKEALAEIKNCAGSQFDPELVAEFIKII